MKITKRHLDKIAGILKEEANIRKDLHNKMYENRNKSVINESLLFENDLHLDAIPGRIVNELDDETHDLSKEFLTTVNNVIYQQLADLMTKAGADKRSPAVWMDDLEEFESYTLEIELVATIAEAIQNYAKQVGELAVHSLGPAEEIEKDPRYQIEPRYSEFE